MAAFRLAIRLSATAIETDVQMSRDGHLLLIHDGTLRRTTNGCGRVSSKSFEELTRLDAGSWFPKRLLQRRHGQRQFERIPSLEELFALAREHKLRLYLEIKTPAPAGIETALVAAIRQAGLVRSCAIICFDAEVLRRVRKIDSEIPLGYLCEKRVAGAVPRAVDLGARFILPRADRVSAKLIADAKANGLGIVTWTVNKPIQMRRLIALGVDGIMSDFPDRLAAAVREADAT